MHLAHQLLRRHTVGCYQARRNPVVRIGQRPSQRHHLTHSRITRVARFPYAARHLNYRLGVEECVARGVIFFHSKRVEERLAGRTYLTASASCHIILKEAEARTTHICFHMAGSGIHRHHTGAQYRLHIKYRVERRHRGIDTAIVAEYAHIGLFVEILHYLLLAQAGYAEHASAFALRDGILYKLCFQVGREFGGIIAVWVAISATLFDKTLLQVAPQVVANSIFGILLHVRVDGGVNLQPIGIDVVFRAIGLTHFLAPTVKRIGFPSYRVVDIRLIVPRRIIALLGAFGSHYATQFFAEIWCNTVVMIHAVKREHKRTLAIFFALLLGDKFSLLHLLEHHIAAIDAAFGVPNGIKSRWILEHSHKCSCFFHAKFVWLLTEIYIRCGFHAHSIVKKVKLIEIHLNDFVLGIESLKFDGYHPLHWFLNGAGEKTVRFGRIEQLGKLLGDSAATTGIFLLQNHTAHQHTQHSATVDARVTIESRIFGSYQRLCQIGRHIIEVHIHAITLAVIESAHLHAIAGKYHRSEIVGWILKFFDRWHITHHAVINQHKQQCYHHHKAHKTYPHPLNDALGKVRLCRHIAFSFLLHISYIYCFLNIVFYISYCLHRHAATHRAISATPKLGILTNKMQIYKIAEHFHPILAKIFTTTKIFISPM